MRGFSTKFLVTMATFSGLAGLLLTDKIKDWAAALWAMLEASGPFWASLTLQDWLLAFTLVGLAIYAIATVSAPRRPISVLRTDVDIIIDPDETHRAKVRRRQHLRANRKGANAYFTRVSPSRNGQVPSVEGSVRFFGKYADKCSGELKKEGEPNSGWECLHQFSPALPFLEVSRIVPPFLLRLDPHDLPRFLSKIVALREFTVEYVDDPNALEFSYRLEADRYPQRRIKVNLTFPKGTLKRFGCEFRARIHAEVRQAYAVAEIRVDWDTLSDQATVRVDRLESAVLQVRWPNLATIQQTPPTQNKP